MTTFKTMAEVKRANKAAGYFWFSPATMQFFAGRVEGELKGGRYFVSSERNGEEPRRYTVREVQPDATIDTVGEFQGYATLAKANAAVRALLAEVDA